MTPGTWFSWAVVYDGTATTSASPFTLYINGVQVSWSTSGSYSGSIEYLGYDASRLHIGKMPAFGSTNTGGFWDDIAFWDSDQSANISTFHNGGTPIDLNLAYNPFSYYRFGDVATDISLYPQLSNEGSTGNVLTAYGGTVADFVSDVP